MIPARAVIVGFLMAVLFSLSWAMNACAAPSTQPRLVRVAAVGALNDGGFWDAVVQRFEQTTGVHVESASTGNKDGMPDLFRSGKCDVIVMSAGDAIVNLVADGYAIDAQPWAKSDVVLVGPASDPAGVKGSPDMATAMKKIAQSKSPFVNHSSSGADEMLRSIVEANHIELDPEQTTALIDSHQRRVFQFAVDKNAYTLIARVPFKNGKLLRGNLALMVEDDPHLRRAVMVAIANPQKFPDAHVNEARRFVSFLLSESTQSWVGQFGKGTIDDRPLFFPVKAAPGATATTRPTQIVLSVVGKVPSPLFLDLDAWSKLPRHQVSAKTKDGSTSQFDGVLLGDLLRATGLSVGNHKMNRQNGSMFVRARASDGYVAIFSMAELDDDFAERSVLLADRRDGKPLDEKEGPLKIICPQDAMPVRWVRQVESLTVIQSD